MVFYFFFFSVLDNQASKDTSVSLTELMKKLKLGKLEKNMCLTFD